MVGVTGFEPTTSWSRTKRSTKLSYTPVRSDGVSLLDAAGQEAFDMFSATSAFLSPNFVRCAVLGLVLGACRTSFEPDLGGADRCDAVLRTPENLTIRRVERGLKPRLETVCAGGPLCLDGNPRAWALRDAPDQTRIFTPGENPFLLSSFSPLPMSEAVRIPGFLPHGTAILWQESDQLRLLAGQGRQGVAARFPAPDLAPGEALAGGFYEDGRWGILVRESETPHGLYHTRWLSPAANDAPMAYPGGEDALVAVYGGVWQGTLYRRQNTWWWHVRNEAEPLAILWPQPTPPAVFQTSTLLLYGDRHEMWVHREGKTPRRISLAPARAIGRVGERLLLRDHLLGIFEVGAEREEPLSSLAAYTDLAGARVPRHSRRERIFWADDEADALLVVERLRLPNCRIEDRVHRLQISTRLWETVASGPGYRTHPTRTGDAFRFVEGTASYRFIGAETNDAE